MGNQCCSQCQTSTAAQSSLINPQSSKSPTITQKPSHIDSTGVPVPNAYTRYVKPPTTIGRQSVIVRDLHNNEDVPDWIWATQNQGILSSGTKQNSVNVQPFDRPFTRHRHTYQPIEGRFKGVQTINLSKLQNKPLTSSQNQKPRNYSNEIPMNGHYSAQPNSFVKSGFPNINTIQSGNQQGIFNSNLRPSISIQDVPVVASVNMNKTESQVEMKMTESKSIIPMSPFQMITQGPTNTNQQTSGSRMVVNNSIRPQDGFSSNAPSVNNSIQRRY